MNRAISVRAPWAFAITDLDKRIENRRFRTAYPGVLFIHASLTKDPAAEERVRAIAKRRGIDVPSEGFVRGAIVARAYLDDIVPMPGSPIERNQRIWAHGPWLWLLRDVEPIEPIPLKGRLGVFNPGRLRVRPRRDAG